MGTRTTSDLVKGVLMDNFGAKRDRTLPNLDPFVKSAYVLINLTKQCAARKGATLDDSGQDSQCELMERWLAAHLYTKSDPLYTSRSTAGASGSFVAGKDEPEPFKDVAMTLDTSGCLAAVLKRNRASALWLGKSPSEQIPYDQRS